MTIVLGVTGGMASGKSTASSMLHCPGSLRFNADAAVHHLFHHHAPAIAKLAAIFPPAHQNGRIDRTALSHALKDDASGMGLQRLEAIIHPFVREMEHAMLRKAARNHLKWVVLDIPLLFETGAEQLCDAVIVTDVSPKLQRARALARPGMTEEKFTALTSRQLDRQSRLEKADFIVTSNLGKAHMRAELAHVMKGFKLW